MSRFQVEEVDCPSCGKKVEFPVNYSVNADRRPDFRDDILDGTFQREECPHCQHEFRLEPELTYVDVGRHQWILVQAASKLAQWVELEDHARFCFDQAYGEGAALPAQEIGKGIVPRVTFGWAALREKVLCGEHGLDDVTLELLKMALVRSAEDVPLADGVELRLVDVQGDELVLAWIKADHELAVEVVNVPRSLYDEIAADAAGGWKALRKELASGAFVDIHRLLVEPAEEPA
jgi:hypothetical protein